MDRIQGVNDFSRFFLICIILNFEVFLFCENKSEISTTVRTPIVPLNSINSYLWPSVDASKTEFVITLAESSLQLNYSIHFGIELCKWCIYLAYLMRIKFFISWLRIFWAAKLFFSKINFSKLIEYIPNFRHVNESLYEKLNNR